MRLLDLNEVTENKTLLHTINYSATVSEIINIQNTFKGDEYGISYVLKVM